MLQTRHVEGIPFIKKRYTKGVHNWYTVGLGVGARGGAVTNYS